MTQSRPTVVRAPGTYSRAVLAWALTIAVALAAGCAAGGDADREAAAGETAGAAAAPDSLSVADVGFQTPESVLHDASADVYLVSNINGGPLDRDGNGFISRVSPDGAVMDLAWIDGQAEGVTLHAPKGMGIKADSLFVSDIDTVRIFHRETGAPLGARGVAGASFLNDVAVGPDGAVYVTDSGLTAGADGFQPTGTDAVHRFGPDGEAVAVASGPELAAPNGVAAHEQGITVITFGGNRVIHMDPSGAVVSEDTLPAGSLDGVIRLADGSLLVSSWEGSAVYRVRPGQPAEAVLEGVEAPADIGYDAGRGRVLVPLFMANRVEVRPVR